MMRMRPQFALVLGVVGMLLLQTETWGQDSAAKKEASVAANAEVASALADVPAGQVAVTYENGKLTIRAQRARFLDVLRAACDQLGAELDAQGEGRETILGVFGPGAPKAVLASLLDGSEFNYAMGGTPDDPNGLASLLVLPRAGAQNQVAQERISQPGFQPQARAAPAAPDVQNTAVATQQVTKLLAQIAHFGGPALGGQEESSGASPAEGVDLAALLQQAETQIKQAVAANGDSGDSAQDTQSPAAPASGQHHSHRRRR